MKTLFTLILALGIIVGFNCFADEIVIDQDNLRVVREEVVVETREDYEHTIADVDREIARLNIIRDEAVRKLNLLNARRDEGR